MALQFNPYPLEPWIRRQESMQRPDLNQTVVQPLMQGIQLWQHNSEAKRQEALKQQMMADENRRWQIEQYGFDPSQQGAYGMPQQQQQMGSGMFNQPQAQRFPADAPLANMGTKKPFNLIDHFNMSRSQKMRPSYMPTQQAPIDYNDPGTWANRQDLTIAKQNQLKGLFESTRKSESPATLDAILAQRVASGELSLEEAYGMKQKNDQPKAPPGFRWGLDGNLEVIPGGPAQMKMDEKKEKGERISQSLKDRANLIISKVDSALSKVSNLSAGFGAMTEGIPMTPARNLSADLDTVKAILGFEQLEQMKSQSSAGASGLGQLSDREMRLLTAARSNLDQAQSPEQLKQRLTEVREHFNNWIMMEQGINPYENKPQGGQQQQSGGVKPITAINPQTKQRITSYDGGQTWQ